jgi:hypothetical protein
MAVDPEFMNGYDQGSRYLLGDVTDGLISQADFALGVVARMEYETAVSALPRHLQDLPVQLKPNGKSAIPEDRVDAFFDN